MNQKLNNQVDQKNILIIGSGGREHAFGWKLSQSDKVSKLFYSPGNGGTAENKGINIPIDGTKKENFEKLYGFIVSEKIDMVIVGPEGPLADGIVDHLNGKGYNRVFGPTKKASLLESDKFFSFDLMNKLHIPQANSIKCYSIEEAKSAINKYYRSEGIVIKARGFAGGKGVNVCDSKNEALKELENYSIRNCPDVLIAERLFGREFSVFVISDGDNIFPFEISFQDYKRSMEGDKGFNTGGMGAYGPVQFVSKEMILDICKNTLTPIIQELKRMKIEYKGFLYAGMILTKNGPKVLEFNVRFGDPECQPAMMLLKSDLYDLLSSILDHKCVDRINNKNIQFHSGSSCCIVLASKGYPGEYTKGWNIYGIEDAENIDNIKIFHAGTKREGNNVISNGGRILGVTAYSPINLEDARSKAYDVVSRIIAETNKYTPGIFSFRRDIAYAI